MSIQSSHKKFLEKAVLIAGSQKKLAVALSRILRERGEKREIKQPQIWNWLHRDKVFQAEYAIPIEMATNGEVTRYDLRPDLFGEAPSKEAA